MSILLDKVNAETEKTIEESVAPVMSAVHNYHSFAARNTPLIGQAWIYLSDCKPGLG